jgi:hypothetical protein
MTGCVQFGSDRVDTAWLGGGVPTSITLPVTVPAVAGSIGALIGFNVGGTTGASLLPPPHAIQAMPARSRRRGFEVTLT